MPAGNGRDRRKGLSLDVMSSIIKSIATIKAALNCSVCALIIATAGDNGDSKYQSYRHGRGFKKPVEVLLKASAFDLSNCVGFEELRQFKYHISDYQIIVFVGLNPDRVMFSGN